ncbi:MAG: hypothetical protein GXO35_07335 [Gammaproteobacteria bacterium]|nr:hypothetical protein [Gammaproteobacteria bacterium]
MARIQPPLRINKSPYYPEDVKQLADSVFRRVVDAYGLKYYDGLGGLSGYDGERADECRDLLRDIEALLDAAYGLGYEDGTAFVRRMARGDVAISEINAT